MEEKKERKIKQLWLKSGLGLFKLKLYALMVYGSNHYRLILFISMMILDQVKLGMLINSLLKISMQKTHVDGLWSDHYLKIR